MRMTAMERQSPKVVYAIVACLSVAAISEVAYLHMKMLSLDYQCNSLAGLDENTRKELQSLANTVKQLQKKGNEESSRRDRNRRELDKNIAEFNKTDMGNETRTSVLNATVYPSKRRDQQTLKTNESKLINWKEEAKSILELSVSSLEQNQTNEQVHMDSCTTSEKGISISIKVKIDNEGNCHCAAMQSNNESSLKKSRPFRPRPRVFLPATKLRGTFGVPIELQCNFTRGKGQMIKWMTDSGELLGEQYFTSDNHSLMLRISDPSKKGNMNYSCYIENEFGTDKKTIQVIFVERDCLSWKQNGYRETGIYTISPDDGPPFDIYCDMETDRGGWNVIQRREDGSVDFYKPWVEYKNGFGNLSREFWIGNDKIHRLTESMDTAIRFDLLDSEGKEAFSVYEHFYVGNESDEYRLRVESYFGTAGDSFLYHNGMKFSTKDKGYPVFGTRCAERFRGAWWYRACHRSNLNGEYKVGQSASSAKGIKWMTFNGDRGSLIKTEMKIRPFKDSSKKDISKKKR